VIPAPSWLWRTDRVAAEPQVERKAQTSPTGATAASDR
jgi:hypothetical protein